MKHGSLDINLNENFVGLFSTICQSEEWFSIENAKVHNSLRHNELFLYEQVDNDHAVLCKTREAMVHSDVTVRSKLLSVVILRTLYNKLLNVREILFKNEV